MITKFEKYLIKESIILDGSTIILFIVYDA